MAGGAHSPCGHVTRSDAWDRVCTRILRDLTVGRCCNICGEHTMKCCVLSTPSRPRHEVLGDRVALPNAQQHRKRCLVHCPVLCRLIVKLSSRMKVCTSSTRHCFGNFNAWRQHFFDFDARREQWRGTQCARVPGAPACVLARRLSRSRLKAAMQDPVFAVCLPSFFFTKWGHPSPIHGIAHFSLSS